MDRYSFTGKGRVLIKAAITAPYGGVDYIANEPIAYFSDVMVTINFANTEKIARTGTDNFLADSKSSASVLRIENINTNDSLQSLLYKRQESNSKARTIVKAITSAGGIAYLPILTGQTLTGTLFIYLEGSKERQTGFVVDEFGKITGLDDGRYKVFYNLDSVARSTFHLENPSLPNLAAEIYIDGNLNGVTGEAVIHLAKLSLLSRPTLDFTSDNPFVDSLEFLILKDKEIPEVNYYGQ